MNTQVLDDDDDDDDDDDEDNNTNDNDDLAIDSEAGFVHASGVGDFSVYFVE